MLSKYVRMFDVKYVDYIDQNVKEFNRNVSKEQELTVKTKCDPLRYEWNIPDEYKKLDVVGYVTDKHLMLTA